MQVNYLKNEPYPIGSLEQDFLGGIAALVKELLTRTDLHEEKQDRLSYWQLIFAQSKVNGLLSIRSSRVRALSDFIEFFGRTT